MEIILMRHGKPAFTGFSKVTSLGMAEWISRYDLSDTGSDMPPQSSKILASKAVDILVTFAKVSNGPVLLMVHGVMNRLIGRGLISLGWKACRRQGNGYWNARVYSLL